MARKITLLFFAGLLIPALAFSQGPGNALYFEGSQQDFVEFGDTVGYPNYDFGSLKLTGDLTIMFWVKFEGVINGNDNIIGDVNNANSNINFWSNSSNPPVFHFYHQDVNSYDKIVGNTSVVEEKWYHFAVTRNGNQLTLYMNGEIDATNNPSPSWSADLIYNTMGWSIANGNFSGWLDELSLWNDALTQEEIQDLMNVNIPSPETQTDLEAYYKFDITDADSISDLSGNGFTGHLGGVNKNNLKKPSFVTSDAYIAPSSTLQSLSNVRVVSDDVTSSTSGGMTIDWIAPVSDADTINHIFFANSGSTGILTSDAPTGTFDDYARTNRTWYFETVNGDITADVSIDLAEATGAGVTPGTLSDYMLMSRSGTSGNFSIEASGAASVNGSVITFTNVTMSDGYFSIGTEDAQNSPLPVEMLYFEAQLDKDIVNLDWATASEKNASYFEVQRSIDGQNFDAIGQVTCAGNATTLTEYDFTDVHPYPGVNYYRLKQVDMDGTHIYTQVVAVEAAKNKIKSVTLIDNPVRGLVKAQLEVEQEGTYELSIFNMQGKVLHNEEVYLLTGQHNLELGLRDAPSGVYILKIANAQETKFTKFLKK